MPDVLVVVNIFLASLLTFLNVRFFITCRQPWRWLKLFIGLVAGGYALLYIVVLFDLMEQQLYTAWFSSTWVRPLNTLMLGALVSSAIYSDRSKGERCNEC